ncbi:oxidoreductase [Alicyclobacillus cellulosilyticus]|uniref:Oxidoreductase n=1 Tax=Alicyclobacillus cellulosilyticus TaxID=1003997 RepID=A0A917K1D2_9BACL|nr:oxidoreductase [Alicyclobacillus cellulosilyticus]
MFDPVSFRGLTLKNRIMVSPMCQYQAGPDGVATDWHFVHYGSLALGGAGLIMVEATAVESRGRISNRDLGLYDDRHVDGLRRMVAFVHSQGVRIGVQLAHAGRKADLAEPIVAPSAVRFSERYQVPHALTEAGLDEVEQAFAAAARRAVAAGFDVIEIHAAHGYLLHQFLSPISNLRTDAYGGSAAGRLRFPLRVVQAVRRAIPDDMPLFIRVSASEWDDRGFTLDEVIQFCQAFREAGVDLVDVSSGGNTPSPPRVYAGYQVPFAQAIRERVKVPVAAVGLLDQPVLADAVIQEGRADLVAIARGFLRDKHWGHTAARALGHPVDPPRSYQRAYLT